MTDWPRYIAMIFYAPMRGMREVRDRGTLLPAIICAYASQIVYLFIIQWLVGISFTARPQVIAANLFQAATSLLPIAIVLVPLLALTANMLIGAGVLDWSCSRNMRHWRPSFSTLSSPPIW